MGYKVRMGLRLSALLLGAGAIARAEFPLASMGPGNLGIQYGLAFRGQNITKASVASHEILHSFTLGYAPIPYLAVEAGISLDKFAVDQYQSARFRGEFGISPTLGLTLASPALMETIRLAGGSRVLLLNSEDERGYAYSGPVTSPWLAVVVSPSGYFDFQAGLLGHFIDGTMEGPDGASRTFSNVQSLRGTLGFTVKSPTEAAFFTFAVDFSPDYENDWTGGPREASIGVACGTLLGWKSKKKEEPAVSPVFPAYPELKERLRKMAEEEE